MRILLSFGLGFLSICCLLHSANLFAGPPQPGPQAPQTKYLIRRITDTDDNGNIDDVKPQIWGTSLVWESGPRGDYDSKQVMFHNPSLNHPLGNIGLGSKMYTPIGAGGNYHLASDRVAWVEDVGGQADLFTSDGLSLTNLSQTSGFNERYPRVAGTRTLYYTQGGLAIDDGINQQLVTPSAGYQLYGRYQANDDYLVYLERPQNNIETGHVLKAYHFDTQVSTSLTNTNQYPNQQWTINGDTEYYQNPNFSIDGSDVYWAATYTADGPYYDNHEIYSYDLAVGPSSYTQVTQNSVDDIFPRAAGGRAAWHQKHVADDPNSTASIILREGGVNAVIEQDAGVIRGLSDSRLVWSNSTDSYTHVLRDGTIYDANSHLGTSGGQYRIVDVSGPNYALTHADYSSDHSTYEWEVFAGYFVGPGAVLTGLDLSYEDFNAHSLRNADMRLTNLEGTLLDDADLRGADLTGATGLEYAIGPAYFSHETLLPAYFNAHDAGWTYQTPEPSGCVAMLVGLLVLGAARIRRRSDCCEV